MDCIILAGGSIKTGDPLYRYTKGKPKALIKIAGQTLIERVAAAVLQSKAIGEIAIVGLAAADVTSFRQELHFLPDTGDLVSNAYSGLEWAIARNPETASLLVCTADTPTITGDLVDEHLALCHPFDKAAYYAFVTRETMEARFPRASRTYTRIDGRDVTSCDLVVLSPKLSKVDRELWDSLASARKHPWKVARIVGASALVRLLAGRMTIAEIEKIANRILSMPVEVFISRRAELAMDIDHPKHLEIIRAELEPTQVDE